MVKKQKTVKLKLVRSLCKCLADHKSCAAGLGLKKINQVVEVLDTPENMGMYKKISYMVEMINE